MEKNCNSDQWWNNDKCRCQCKKCHVCEKDYVWNPATCHCENGKYSASIVNDKLYDETNFNEKKTTCKTETFYILLAFL